MRWSLPLIGYVVVAFQNHRGLALFGAGIVLIVIALTMVSGSRRRSRRRDEEDKASPDSGNPRRSAPQAGDADTLGDTDALGGAEAAFDWPFPRHGDEERPTTVPAQVPSFGQDRT